MSVEKCVTCSKENDMFVLRAYCGSTLIHEYEGEEKIKLLWEFETENPSFRNVKLLDYEYLDLL